MICMFHLIIKFPKITSKRVYRFLPYDFNRIHTFFYQHSPDFLRTLFTQYCNYQIVIKAVADVLKRHECYEELKEWLDNLFMKLIKNVVYEKFKDRFFMIRYQFKNIELLFDKKIPVFPYHLGIGNGLITILNQFRLKQFRPWLEKATGKYIGFVDSDDYIDEKMFEHLIENMENTGANNDADQAATFLHFLIPPICLPSYTFSK